MTERDFIESKLRNIIIDVLRDEHGDDVGLGSGPSVAGDTPAGA